MLLWYDISTTHVAIYLYIFQIDGLLCFLTARVLMDRCGVEQRPALVSMTHHTIPGKHFYMHSVLSSLYTFTPAVDCGWSEWTAWSACSRTCDVGIRRRYRSGTNPAPAFGGRACEGDRIGLDTCSITPCFGTVITWLKTIY